MRSCLSFFRLAAWSLLAAGGAIAQDDPPSPQVALDYLKQLVQVKNAASHEKAKWLEEEASMRDRISLFGKELSQLKALVESAGDSASETSEKRAALVQEEDDLKLAAAQLSRLLAKLEASLLRITAFFPAPLARDTADATQRLQDHSPSRRNRDRLKDILAILLEAEKFQRTIVVEREWRVLDDEREVEVQVLYLGLGQAFYVAAAGQQAGIGYPAAQGWQWEKREGIAADLAAALDILADHPERARFLKLPVKLRPAP